MNFKNGITKIKSALFKNKPKIETIIYTFFVICFLFYAFADLVTSGQTYHYQSDRRLSYISLGFLVFSLALGIIVLFIKSIRNKTTKSLLKRVNPFLLVSMLGIVIITGVSGFINKSPFSSIFLVIIYPSIFLAIYIFFIEMFHFNLNKKILFASFLLFFIFYTIFFVFYFFYIQGKPTSGGGLRIPTLAHVFFLLSIFCFLRRFLYEKAKIVLYLFCAPIILLSGKMSVLIIFLIFFMGDLFQSEFFDSNKKLMTILLSSLATVAVVVIIIANFTKNNFLADNFSLESLIISGRIENWNNILPIMKSFTPLEWVFGKGPSATLTFNNGTAAHNDFIEFIFDYGVVGLLAFLCFVASIFVQFLKQTGPFKRELGLSILYLLVLNLISAFFINMNMLYMILLIRNDNLELKEEAFSKIYYEVYI